jgi:outer membrane lipopolysaccharide assembly protein LptE/RlpB
MRYIIRLIPLLLTALSLASCGLQLRETQLSPPLHTLALTLSTIDNSIQYDVIRLLRSLDVNINQHAPVTLYISEFNFSHTTPDFTRTSQAVSYTYTMKIVFSIIKAKKVCYPPTTLTASRTIWMNLNQVYTSATDRLAKEELERDIINALYYHLISDKMRTALTN